VDPLVAETERGGTLIADDTRTLEGVEAILASRSVASLDIGRRRLAQPTSRKVLRPLPISSPRC
jgi:hypothetical protein